MNGLSAERLSAISTPPGAGPGAPGGSHPTDLVRRTSSGTRPPWPTSAPGRPEPCVWRLRTRHRAAHTAATPRAPGRRPGSLSAPSTSAMHVDDPVGRLDVREGNQLAVEVGHAVFVTVSSTPATVIAVRLESDVLAARPRRGRSAPTGPGRLDGGERGGGQGLEGRASGANTVKGLRPATSGRVRPS